MMSVCIVAAQGVMLPIAMVVGCKADIWGRQPLSLAGFAILPIRAVRSIDLFGHSPWLIAIR